MVDGQGGAIATNIYEGGIIPLVECISPKHCQAGKEYCQHHKAMSQILQKQERLSVMSLLDMPVSWNRMNLCMIIEPSDKHA